MKKLFTFFAALTYMLSMYAVTPAAKTEEEPVNHTITLTWDVDGGDLGGDIDEYDGHYSYTCLEGTEFTFYAYPRETDGYEFAGWFENGELLSTDNPLNLEMTRDYTIEARFTLMQLDVTILATPEEGGTVTGAEDGKYPWGTELTLTATPAEVGYVFNMWEVNGVAPDGAYEQVLTITVQEDMEIKATFDYRECSITVQVDYTYGDVEVIAPDPLLINSMVTIKALPNEGYEFVKWDYLGETLSTEAEYTFKITEDMNIAAEFDVAKHDVVIDATHGFVEGSAELDGMNVTDLIQVENAITTVDITHGAALTLSADDEIDEDYGHYLFAGWLVDGEQVSKEATHTFVITKPVTIKAVFEAPTYTVSLVANDDNLGEVAGGGTYQEGEVITLTATPKEGAKFVEWYSGSTGFMSDKPVCEYTVTADDEVTATFEKITYKVTIYSMDDAMGYVMNEGENIVEYGQAVSLSATPNAGYEFVSWTIDGEVISTEANYYDYVPTKDVTIHANFRLITHTLTLSVNNEEWGTVEGGGVHVPGEVTIKAIANEGYEFVHWKKGDDIFSTQEEYTFELTEDLELVAHFKSLNYYIELAVEPGEEAGFITGAMTGMMQMGTVLNLTAAAEEGYKFVHWYIDYLGEVSTDIHYTHTVTGDAKITAVFEMITYKVEVYAADDKMGTVMSEGERIVEYGQTVELSATPNEGYEFVSWTIEGEVISTEAYCYDYVPTKDVVIYANFKEVVHSAVDNIEVGNAPVKVVENGQVLIKRGAATYNVLGAEVK